MDSSQMRPVWRMGILIMRTTIVIDDTLMAATLRATGLKTKREVVELGLRTLLRLVSRRT